MFAGATAGVLIICCLNEASLLGFWGSYGDWFADKPLNLRYFSNCALIMFLASACITFPALNGGMMRRFADDSFGIFFLHNLVLLVPMVLLGRSGLTGVYIVDSIIYTALIFGASWGLVQLIKNTAQRHSRWLIGA